jgi:hypothetical protein
VRFSLVGFLDRRRAGRPASIVQELVLPIDLDLYAPLALIAELTVELTTVLPDRPEMPARLPRARRRFVVGCGWPSQIQQALGRRRSPRRARRSLTFRLTELSLSSFVSKASALRVPKILTSFLPEILAALS